MNLEYLGFWERQLHRGDTLKKHAGHCGAELTASIDRLAIECHYTHVKDDSEQFVDPLVTSAAKLLAVLVSILSHCPEELVGVYFGLSLTRSPRRSLRPWIRFNGLENRHGWHVHRFIDRFIQSLPLLAEASSRAHRAEQSERAYCKNRDGHHREQRIRNNV
jgi:hypothetical protein